MFVYLFLVIFCFLLSFVKQSKLILSISFLVIASILCFGYMTGSDWRMYERYYYNKIIYDREYLYGFISKTFNFLKVDFWIFFITLKIILLTVFFSLYRWLKISVLSAMLIFIPTIGLFLFVDNPMRNLIAYAIFAYSVRYIVSREFFKYLFFILIAVFFHNSAIIVLPVYFLYRKKFSTNVLICLYVLINILFASQSIVLFFIKYFSYFLPIVGDRIILYLNSFAWNSDLIEFKGVVFTFGLITKTFGFFVLLYFKERIISEFKYGKLVFVLSIIYLLLYRIGLTFPLITRITIFFDIFYVAAIVYILMLMRPMNSILIRLVICFYMLFSTFKLTTSSFKFVPYTNYIIYALKGDFPSFKERANFNYDNSPYNLKEGTKQ